MNKWKVAFYCCLIALVLTISLSVYAILDQAVALTYQETGYSDTENDLDRLIEMINQTDLSKTQISRVLKDDKLYPFMNFEADTISLTRVSLIFENNQLKSITKQW